ncbi:MAG: nucleoside hydrolase, partial [Bacteroidota bacterium]
MKNKKARINQIYLLFFFLCNLSYIHAQDQNTLKVILDADTGNEVDDFYALARALAEPSWDIICLNAAQWQASQWAIPETMENSHRLNQVILGEMKMDIKTRRGGVNRMFDWGDMAQHSAAAYEIIKQCQKLENDKKLNIVALGALTNVASAIYIDSTIASKIRLYWLGTTYDFEKDIFKRQDFNCMMDPQALEIVLMSEVEMHVMPVNVAAAMVLNYDETSNSLPSNSNLSRLLLDRWYQHLDGGRKERTIWDLALIQAMLFPAWTEKVNITTSKD